MHLRHLSLVDFRSYPGAEVALTPGITTFIGRNGQGKTNLVEAAGYLASLSSHRVATDQPLVRFGADSAVVRGAVVREGRESLIELEIVPGRANRARLNRSVLTRPRDVLGTLRTVLFAPEDLALVKGEPDQRRRLLDDLLVARQPRWAGVRADYDKVLKQRNALLRSAAHLWREPKRRGGTGRSGAGRSAVGGPQLASGQSLDEARESALSTLEVWDSQLAGFGGSLLYARLRLLRDLAPYLSHAYEVIAAAQSPVAASYRSSLDRCPAGEEMAARIAQGEVPEQEALSEALFHGFAALRSSEQERGVTLLGPHRDEVVLTLGELPAKGYASHGESWSVALALRLAGFHLLRHDLGTDPVLVLDDVFAELDAGRRARLAELVADCEQVLITAAVGEDVPAGLVESGVVFDVHAGSVVRRAADGAQAPDSSDAAETGRSLDGGARPAGDKAPADPPAIAENESADA